MAKITLILEDTGENTVDVGGEFPKDTNSNALTLAEELTFLLSQLINIANTKPKAYEWIRNIVGDAATQVGEPVMGVMSSDDFDAAMDARRRTKHRPRPLSSHRKDN
jgi:hypothetical protein